MTWYVHRINGVVTSMHAELQPDYAEEALSDSDAAVLTFIAAGKPADPSDMNNLSKAIKAALLVVAAWTSHTPAQAKAAFKVAWDSLP